MSKTALIISASSDIASATARLLAEKKYSITLTSRNTQSCAELAKEITNISSNICLTMSLDVRNVTSFDDFFLNLKDTPELVLFCAGKMESDELISSKNRGYFSQEIKDIVDTNFTGPIIFLSKLKDYLVKKDKKASIIILSSVAGDRGRLKNPFYGSSKAGLSSFSSSIRQELGKSKISVITIKPGFVRTKMTKNLKLPKLITSSPEQIAKIIYLAHKKKKNIVYSKFWFLIMFVVKSIPEFIFKKLNF